MHMNTVTMNMNMNTTNNVELQQSGGVTVVGDETKINYHQPSQSWSITSTKTISHYWESNLLKREINNPTIRITELSLITGGQIEWSLVSSEQTTRTVRKNRLLESSKCERRGGSNVKATTDKFDSMRAFSEEVVKVLSCCLQNRMSTHLVRVVLYFWLLAYFPSLGGGIAIYGLSIRGCVSMLLLPLSPYYKSRDSMNFGGHPSNTISDTCG